jgi:TniQ protein
MKNEHVFQKYGKTKTGPPEIPNEKMACSHTGGEAGQGDGEAGSEAFQYADDIWNAEPPDVPERSRFFYMEPIGRVTGEVESATSYLARLAAAHTVSTWSLLKCEIGPRLFGAEAILRYRLGELVTTMGAAFNGENGTSRTIISILEQLTGRKDLSQTSMAFCRGFISPRFLVRVKQSWCCECLSEWKVAGREIYSPLLWHLMAVNVCPRHGIPLRMTCHECGKSFPPLTAHSRVGFCPRCGSWLGSSRSSFEAITPHQTTDLEIARLACDFMRDGPGALTACTESVFPQNVDLLLHRFFGGNVAALARFLKMNRYTIIAWKDRTQRPTLLSLADVSLKVSVSPAALLSVRLQGDEFVLRTDTAGKVSGRRFTPPRELNLKRMQQALENAVKGNVSPQPSLSQVASRFGCDQTTLDRRFPDLAKQVKELYRQSCVARKEARSKQLESIVRKTTIDIHNAGNYPSQYKVRQALPSSIDMRDPPANKAWKQTLVELGLCMDEEHPTTGA